MKPIRILHFVSDVNITGGVMGIIMNLYRNIDKEKVQFDFMYFDKDENNRTYEEEIKDLGGNIFYITSPVNVFKFSGEFDHFLKENGHKYSAIHLHEVYLNSLIGIIAKKNKIKNVISHSHATKYSDKKINSIRNKILCLPLKSFANIYFACSKAAGSFLYGEKFVKDGKVKIINNAVDCEKFRYNKEIRKSIRTELNIEDKLVVGHVGRFSNQKNHDFLIDIFKSINQLDKKSVLLLVGQGELYNKIQSKVKTLGLEKNVIFLGQRNDVEKILQGMDIFLLPSLYEGLPVIGVEAQASGLPCFMANTVTDEVDITDVQYFALDDNPKIIAKDIIKYYENFSREDTIEDIRRLGFDISTEAKKLEKFYLEL